MKPEISPAAHLNPCPCCGGEASFLTRASKYNTIAFAQCDVCQLQSRVFSTELPSADDNFDFSDVAYKIAALWNHRTPLTDTVPDSENGKPKVYMLYTPIFPGYKKFIRYIQSSLPQERLEDIIVGLDFYVHDVIKDDDDEWTGIPEDHVVYFLSENFGCTEATKQEWKEQSGSRPEIDIFTARRKRYNKNHQEYIDIISPYEGTPFIEAYRHLEEAKAEREKNTQPDQLVQKFFDELGSGNGEGDEQAEENPDKKNTALPFDDEDEEPKIYQIFYPAGYPNYTRNARYVESNLPLGAIENLVIGLELYLEENSNNKTFCAMPEDYAAYFLTQLCHCKPSTEEAWKEQSDDNTSINLIKSRFQHCKSDSERLIKIIKPFGNNDLIQAYLDLYNSPDACYRKTPADELLKEYREKHS